MVALPKIRAPTKEVAGHTNGGYSDKIVVNQRFVFQDL
jgi:hypothetical protein